MTKPQSSRARRKKRNTDASGQALGYALQYTRLTHMLLEAAPEAFCSLECLDDIAEESPRDGLRLVQSKSALTANPVADRAKSLWKTFSNWLDLLSSADYQTEHTIFEIYVSRPVDGPIVRAFHDATTIDAASAAIAAARLALWGPAPDFALRESLSPEIATYVNRVLALDESRVSLIIRNFRLVCGSGSPSADLEDLIRTHPVRPSKVRDIADYICGVVKRRVDELLEKALPAVISRDEIHTIYSSFCRKVDSDTVLTSFAKHPTRDEAMRNLPEMFVRQLDLIGLDFEDKLEAINDFLMACADRTEWAIRGDVDESSFDDLNDKLRRTWKNRRSTLSILHQALPLDRQGELLYRNCLEEKAPLQAKDTPAHFIPGCLHRLADDLFIGWHPSYESLLKVKRAA
ncbi:MAG: hypothetical protein PHS32_09205 [Rhodoferax sp.]|uniref:ABC-three component system protein n=1 Tax=Rhodoferax sp. TaxID=50421 RepID=UPI0026039A67|nr:ABC-three component system protein [Rhodoferax sp.]MDD5333912.1 hypothetical protein [Rhodoferax sp.]